ncbi:hypothetical protein CCO04_00585 [Pimelobacter sp. 30-1]|nr:hypothetical protein [Pimelobacter sp. 30-1]
MNTGNQKGSAMTALKRSRARSLAAASGLALCLALTACNSAASDDDGSSSAGGVNLDDCPDPAAVKKEIKDQITLGYSAPLSGPVAGVVEVSSRGFKARIEAANAAGGIDGVPIKIEYLDDAFSPDKAKANVTQFIEKMDVDILNTFGAGQVGAMADDQNAACVPLLYPSSSDPKYLDMKNYPWTVQFLPSAAAETSVLVHLIQEKVPDAVVGVAENETASGKAQSEAFQEAAKEAGLDIKLVTSDTDPNAAATALKEAGATVVYHAGVVGTCGAFDTARGRIGYEPELVVAASNCANAAEYLASGDAADGVTILRYYKDPADPALKDDAAVKEYLAALGDADDPSNSITVAGWLQADLLVNTLQQAADSDAGLSQLGIIEAARDQDYAAPILINGINWVSAADRPAGVNGFEPISWSTAEKRFVSAGDVVPTK